MRLSVAVDTSALGKATSAAVAAEANHLGARILSRLGGGGEEPIW